MKARDILTLSEINLAVKTGDKQLLKNFDYKVFLSDKKVLANIGKNDLTNMVQQDMEKLGVLRDLEKLGAWDAERLGTGFKDAEQLGYFKFNDAEQLGTENLANDAEQLGHASFTNDAEQLGNVIIYFDAEQLGSYTMAP